MRAILEDEAMQVSKNSNNSKKKWGKAASIAADSGSVPLGSTRNNDSYAKVPTRVDLEIIRSCSKETRREAVWKHEYRLFCSPRPSRDWLEHHTSDHSKIRENIDTDSEKDDIEEGWHQTQSLVRSGLVCSRPICTENYL
jgi:hypothetical protein